MIENDPLFDWLYARMNALNGRVRWYQKATVWFDGNLVQIVLCQTLDGHWHYFLCPVG